MRLKKIKTTFDVTIGQYQKFAKLDEPTNIDIVSIFYNIDKEAVKLISNKQVNQLTNEIKAILKPKHKHVLKWGGLGFEPDLENMTAGAFYDAIKYGESIETAHLLTAVLYRPIIKRWFNFSKRYEVKPYEGTFNIAEKSKHLPLALYLGASAFFLNLRNDFLTAIRNRFQAKSKQLNQSLNKKDCKETGETLSHFMQLLEEITNDSFTKYQTNLSTK